MFEFWVTLSATFGYILSLLYEKVTLQWHGKDLKRYVFWFICIVIGGGVAYLNKELSFTKLDWSSIEAIFLSTAEILKWGIAIIACGEAFFNKWIHKKTATDTLAEITSRRVLGTKETSRKN